MTGSRARDIRRKTLKPQVLSGHSAEYGASYIGSYIASYIE